MTSAPTRHDPAPGPEVLDVAGVGFGPSNLALAIALDELGRPRADRPPVRLTSAFLEKQPRFGWHRGMLIDGTTMQVSFLKDLVTMRDPTSPHSFLAYLHDKGRLADFINHRTFYPSRVEFHDYLEWVASRAPCRVDYGVEVTAVRPVEHDGAVVAWDVVGERGGARVVRRARDVVLATGLRPRMPAGVERSDRVWHSSELLHRLAGHELRPTRLTVVGAGQSGAEVTGHLHTTFPDAEVCAVFSRYGYSVADDSPFANRIFDPGAVDDFVGADRDVRRMLLDYHGNTNYSVVDLDLIQQLYGRAYQERVTGRRRLRFLNASRVREVRPHAAGVDLVVEHLPTATSTTLRSDVVVFATGYSTADPLRLVELGDRRPVTDADGRPVVDGDYRVALPGDVRAGLYLQGSTEHVHGITADLLSTTAVRAGRIAESVARGRARATPPAPPGSPAPPPRGVPAWRADPRGQRRPAPTAPAG